MAESLHPDEGSVTTRRYVPPTETTVLELVGVVPAGLPELGPIHEYVAPGIDELPVSVTVGEEHVMPAPTGLIATSGDTFAVISLMIIYCGSGSEPYPDASGLEDA